MLWSTHILWAQGKLLYKTEMEKDGTKTKSECKENPKNKNIDKEKN